MREEGSRGGEFGSGGEPLPVLSPGNMQCLQRKNMHITF